MSTENNAESATTLVGESDPPQADQSTADAVVKPGPASDAIGAAIQSLAGASDNSAEGVASTDGQSEANAETDPQAQISDLRASLVAAERVAAQYHAAAEAGLPLDIAGRLQGNTADELAADAAALLAHLRPAENLRVNGDIPLPGPPTYRDEGIGATVLGPLSPDCIQDIRSLTMTNIDQLQVIADEACHQYRQGADHYARARQLADEAKRHDDAAAHHESIGHALADRFDELVTQDETLSP